MKMSALDQEMIKTEMNALKDLIRQLQEDKITMLMDKDALEDKLCTQQGEQKDIFQYLNGELAKKQDKIEELTEKVTTLEEKNEELVTEHDAELQGERDSRHEETARLHDELASYSEKLLEVREFMENKNTLEAELADRKKQLEDESKEHAMHLSDLERKHVQEKDRLKKEMLLKLRETKANLLKMTDNQLDTTTKRTIAENEQMSSELAWQSKETEKLIRKNEKLMSDNAMLKRELSLHQETQQEMGKKVHVYQRTIKTLLGKLSNLDASQKAELQRLQTEEEEQQRKHAEESHRIAGLEGELAAQRSQLQEALNEAGVQQLAQAELKAKHEQMMRLQGDAVKFTLQCMRDIKVHQLLASPSSSVAFLR